MATLEMINKVIFKAKLFFFLTAMTTMCFSCRAVYQKSVLFCGNSCIIMFTSETHREENVKIVETRANFDFGDIHTKLKHTLGKG